MHRAYYVAIERGEKNITLQTLHLIAAGLVMTMASLPKECRAVLDAPAPVSEAAVTLGDVGATIAATATPPIAASAFSPTPGADVPTPFPRPVN